MFIWKVKSMTRHESRELAFILIFEKGFQQELSIDELITNAAASGVFKANSFAENLAKSVFENIEVVDTTINENLVGWSMSRISKVARAILRLSVCEMMFSNDIPVGVSINEAVEIAKKYATQDDASYINGVLGSISKKLEK